MKIILTSIITVLIAIAAYGETPADTVKVYFRVGHGQFDPALDDNRAVMDNFVKIVRKANENNDISRISVSGFASPDGSSNANERLARLRCDAIADYVSKHTGVSMRLIETHPGGVAWEELRRMVEKDPEVPSRDEVLDILDHVPVWIYNSKGMIVDGRKKRLMELDHGKTYQWMLKNLFPALRNAVAVTAFYRQKDEETALISEETPAQRTDLTDVSENPDKSELPIRGGSSEEAIITEEYGESDNTDVHDVTKRMEDSEFVDLSLAPPKKPFYMAIKNNMLYDAALIPNIGAEFYLGKDLSMYGEWMYAWWEKDARHRYWQIYGGDLGLRWWFGRKAHAKPLTGHHLGMYAGAIIFDFEFGETGYMGGKPGGKLWDRCIANIGFEYGYSLPVAKRLNIDFSIGLGYLGGHYIKYFPFDNDYYREKEYRIRYFGPTKAEISLVWLIGRGNTNQRKGGDK